MLKDFDDNCLQTIMNHAKTNLRKKADGGKKADEDAKFKK